MADNSFFGTSREQSRVKTAIVSKYFWAWAKVVIPTAKKKDHSIAYIDLFSGPGIYKDGTKSTPLLVLEKAAEDPDMRAMLVSVFNDIDAENAQSLESAIASTPNIDKLKHKPIVINRSVGSEIVRDLEAVRLVPTLLFVDPWGYKGLSLQLINSVLKWWGCDCIIFFNYNRINMGLPNGSVTELLNDLFGQERAVQLRTRLGDLSPEDREYAIVEEIAQALKDLGGKFVLPFRFMDDSGKRTSHHLIFVSKAFRGYEIMKGIMAKESTNTNQGVPNFEYNPADKRYRLLFELSRPLDDLEGMLLEHFAGRQLTMRQLYEEHSVGRPFVERNYKSALHNLVSSGKISLAPGMKRRGTTFGDNISVIFPGLAASGEVSS